MSTQKQFGPIVIFGGASGIGLATAELAVAAHREVVIADINAGGPELEIVRSGRVQFASCDAGDPDAVGRLLETVSSRHDGLAAVVTTVGGAHPHDPLEVDLAAWRRELAFNLDTAYVVATTAARVMKATGGGSIITTSSTIGYVPRADRLGYGVAKAGVVALTKSLALAVGREGVRVNCVAPHSTDTPRFRKLIGTEEALEQRLQASPQGRICVPEDLANTILFLASPAAVSMTGQVLWVNNGSYMP
jgi:NAD(P)-dependent dehydrogenase (short-subunit alcohol dehydrogenase family)